MTSDSIKDNFYNQLSAIIQSTSPHNNLIILGDLNAVTRSANLSTSGVVGPFGSGRKITTWNASIYFAAIMA